MRIISSKKYAEVVEDTICECLENAIEDAFDIIAKELGCIADYDERQSAAIGMVNAFQYGMEATWRDQTIELFELYGIDVRPDGEDY